MSYSEIYQKTLDWNRALRFRGCTDSLAFTGSDKGNKINIVFFESWICGSWELPCDLGWAVLLNLFPRYSATTLLL